MLRDLTYAKRRALTFVISLAMLESIGLPSFAQQERKKGDEAPLRLETTLVEVPVTVTNARGTYVSDMKQRDFALFEDGARQQIEFFRTVEEPFSVALLIDSSNSTSDQLDQIREAVSAFLDNLRSRDRAMIIQFNDSVEKLTELTSDKEVLRRSLNEIESGEFTQVYEAVYTAVWEEFENVQGRKAAIVFTDGIDTASSEISAQDTIDAVLDEEDVVVYPIRYSTKRDVLRKLARKYDSPMSPSVNADPERAIPDDVRLKLDQTYRKADSYLEQLANSSGGVMEYADSLSDLKPALQRIANELRQQYLLAYYPSNTDKTRELRRIEVRSLRPGVKVRARPAYNL